MPGTPLWSKFGPDLRSASLPKACPVEGGDPWMECLRGRGHRENRWPQTSPVFSGLPRCAGTTGTAHRKEPVVWQIPASKNSLGSLLLILAYCTGSDIDEVIQGAKLCEFSASRPMYSLNLEPRWLPWHNTRIFWHLTTGQRVAGQLWESLMVIPSAWMLSIVFQTAQSAHSAT